MWHPSPISVRQLHIVEFLLDYDTENPQALHEKEARLIRKVDT